LELINWLQKAELCNQTIAHLVSKYCNIQYNQLAPLFKHMQYSTLMKVPTSSVTQEHSKGDPSKRPPSTFLVFS